MAREANPLITPSSSTNSCRTPNTPMHSKMDVKNDDVNLFLVDIVFVTVAAGCPKPYACSTLQLLPSVTYFFSSPHGTSSHLLIRYSYRYDTVDYVPATLPTPIFTSMPVAASIIAPGVVLPPPTNPYIDAPSSLSIFDHSRTLQECLWLSETGSAATARFG